MLLGAAHLRCDERDRALRYLSLARARSGEAHPTIRSEIALYFALAAYGVRDLDEADRELDEVSPEADIIHARALEYRGWISLARSDFEGSRSFFTAALQRLDQCRYYDRFLEANSLRALSHYAAEMLDRDLGVFVRQRAARIDWRANGLAEPRFWVTFNEAVLLETEGHVDDALDRAWTAEQDAPSAALALQARCLRAMILGHERESYSQRSLMRSARVDFERLAQGTLIGDERNVALIVAEGLAQVGDGLSAARVLSAYRAAHKLSPMLSMAQDPRRAALERLVEAQVGEANGDFTAAHHGYRDAFRILKRIGHTGRATYAAIRLGEITGQAYLFEYATTALQAVPKSNWLRRRLQNRRVAVDDEVLRSLSLTDREVLRLLCEGKRTKEIAAARRRSENTIRNTLHKLFGRFGVRNRGELISEAVRRGFFRGRRSGD